MKSIRFFLALLVFGLQIEAQKLTLRPSLSFAAMYSSFQNSTIPEPYFSTTFSRSSFQGLNIEWQLNKKYTMYFKIANYQVSNSVRDVNQRKPDLFDFVLGESIMERGTFVTLFGAGIKTDITKKRTRNKLYLNLGVNLASQSSLDSLGGISGPYFTNTGYVKNFTFRDYKQKDLYPLFELGISHPFLNKRNKEILEINFLVSHAFQKVFSNNLDFDYIGPRYGGPTRQRAIFASRAFSFQFVISKGIGILNRKK